MDMVMTLTKVLAHTGASRRYYARGPRPINDKREVESVSYRTKPRIKGLSGFSLVPLAGSPKFRSVLDPPLT